jgi:hypothetical protein
MNLIGRQNGVGMANPLNMHNKRLIQNRALGAVPNSSAAAADAAGLFSSAGGLCRLDGAAP